jgi:hypothetical protein
LKVFNAVELLVEIGGLANLQRLVWILSVQTTNKAPQMSICWPNLSNIRYHL